jgi:hypothetical protein
MLVATFCQQWHKDKVTWHLPPWRCHTSTRIQLPPCPRMQAAFLQLCSARHEACSNKNAMMLLLTGSIGATSPLLTSCIGDLAMVQWMHMFLAMDGSNLSPQLTEQCKMLQHDWQRVEGSLEEHIILSLGQMQSSGARHTRVVLCSAPLCSWATLTSRPTACRMVGLSRSQVCTQLSRLQK